MTELVRNKYYFDEHVIDLSVLRKEAINESTDTRFGPVHTVVIHHHRFGQTCLGKQHETYQNGKEV